MQDGIWLGYSQDGNDKPQQQNGNPQQQGETPQRRPSILAKYLPSGLVQASQSTFYQSLEKEATGGRTGAALHPNNFYRSLESSALLSTPPQVRKSRKRSTVKPRKISAYTAPKPDDLAVQRLLGGFPGGTNSQQSLAASDGELESRDDIGQGTGLDLTGNLPHQQNVGRVSSWAVGFERLLQDPLGLECFTLYLKKEFSDENIMFWIACEQMSKVKDKILLEKHAQDIYNKYLSPKATNAVNLDSKCRELVEEAINNPTPEMFRTQQQQIFKLMKFDSYSRFLKSKMYQDCVLAEMGGEKLPFMNKHSPNINKPQDPAKLAAEEKAQKKKVRPERRSIRGDDCFLQ